MAVQTAIAEPDTTPDVPTGDCPFCHDPLVDSTRGEDELTPTHCRGLAHERCHALECTTRDCWVDTDAGWYALHD